MPYDPKIKAAVIADILSGNNAKDTARKHNVSPYTVTNWARQYRVKINNVASDVIISPEKIIADDITAYLHTALETLKELNLKVRNDEWFAKQTAEGVAVLYSTIADKSYNIVALIGRRSAPVAEPITIDEYSDNDRSTRVSRR